MDHDEIDLAILDLFEHGDENGVSPFQMARYLRERITIVYAMVADLEDQQADDPFPMQSTATH